MAISKHEENERRKKRYNEAACAKKTKACDNEQWDRIKISMSSQ